MEVDGAALRLLGRHVRDRAQHSAFAGLQGARGRAAVLLGHRELGQAEVEDLGAPVRGHQDVFGLEVAMHDPLLVRGGQRVRHLRADRQQPSGGEGALREQRAHGRPVHQLHHDVVMLAGHAEVVDGHDVRVVEGGSGPCLPLQPRDARGVSSQRFRQRLQGDIAAQASVARAIDLAHAARGQQRTHFVWPQADTGFEQGTLRGRGQGAGLGGDQVMGLGPDQRLDRCAQLRVVPTGVRHEMRPLLRVPFERRGQDVLDLAPPLRRHGRSSPP